MDKLASKVRNQTFMLMSPYPGLDAPISLQAWGYQLKLDNANDSRIDAFIDALRQNATQEPQAGCSGGITDTDARLRWTWLRSRPSKGFDSSCFRSLGTRRARCRAVRHRALCFSLLVGFGAGLLTRPGTPGDDSADAGFARDMSAHHAQAVEMGMIAYQKATLPEVRTLGGDIAITQQGQIGVDADLAQGLGSGRQHAPAADVLDAERPAELLKATSCPGWRPGRRWRSSSTATGKQVDILFCQYMLRHHLGGIHMVDGVLAQNPTPEVKELAETMKKNQTAEVTVLRTLLTQLGAQPL